MSLTLISRPSVEPVSLGLARAHLRVTSTDQDEYIEHLIRAARQRLELDLGRAFVDQTWEDKQPTLERQFYIPRPPLLELISVKYIDDAEVEQTLDSSEYDLVVDYIMPSMVSLKFETVIPSIEQRPDAVRIRFRAGYPYDEAMSPPEPKDINVPDQIRQAILLLVSMYFEQREEVILTPVRQELQRLPDGVEALLIGLRVPPRYG